MSFITLSNLFISLGLMYTAIGCFFAIIDVWKQDSKGLYTGAVMGMLAKGHVESTFKQKYRQVEGFILILIGSVLQLVPAVIDLSNNIIFNKPLCLLCEIILIVIFSIIFDKIMCKFSKLEYKKEDNRRKSENKD